VVKSLQVVKDEFGYGYSNPFNKVEIVREPLIIAKNKEEVKKILLDKYPQFFPNNKVYSKETKDEAQFFYVIIFELYEWEKQQIINDTSWSCSYCKQKHENTYVSKPVLFEKLFGKKTFCRSDEDFCLNEYKKQYYKDVEMPDDEWYIKETSLNYIYKITEKSTGKCYIGKTKNAPFFRWWNHLTRSSSPFGLYLRNQTKLSDWTFEVLEELPTEMELKDVLKIESEYIKQFDSIRNGYNSVISNKSVSRIEELELDFDNQEIITTIIENDNIL
jgi:hypothetical protein